MSLREFALILLANDFMFAALMDATWDYLKFLPPPILDWDTGSLMNRYLFILHCLITTVSP